MSRTTAERSKRVRARRHGNAVDDIVSSSGARAIRGLRGLRGGAAPSWTGDLHHLGGSVRAAPRARPRRRCDATRAHPPAQHAASTWPRHIIGVPTMRYDASYTSSQRPVARRCVAHGGDVELTQVMGGEDTMVRFGERLTSASIVSTTFPDVWTPESARRDHSCVRAAEYSATLTHVRFGGQASTRGVQVGRCASKASMSVTWRRVMPMSSRPSSRR